MRHDRASSENEGDAGMVAPPRRSSVLASHSLALLIFVAAPTNGQTIRAPEAPPPPQVESPGPPPSTGAIWIAGRWAWQDGRFVWVRGNWEKEPAGAWLPGRWKHTAEGWVWEGGRWKR